ncbi:flagellar basal-body rod protein FlgB [Desulforamulus putei DSM 12395]|uniref:Flagellar basal body rod protein FlgB n=1 Tax=Desulforamulus putei DSM 12395 TaxID=1121429 RepID=A0A1M5D0E6_9FIRM|nr:flagellar basal body rod protein FlgB [Desulforamulus putei]SHF60468.1 flagellar basal-body rod protein FlgB [Desulforamulus putei DSM 12395]
MLDKILNSKNIIHKALDASWKRNEAIAQNIVNADTPGYKRKTVSFEEDLREAMESKDFKKSSVDKIEINVTEDNTNLSMRLDGNNVVIEAEVAALAKNTIQYNALTQLAGYSKLKMVIKEGK